MRRTEAQKEARHEELYQGWGASHMATRIVNLEDTLHLILEGLESGAVRAKAIIDINLDAESMPVRTLDQVIQESLNR
jgi:hypothetical protein